VGNFSYIIQGCTSVFSLSLLDLVFLLLFISHRFEVFLVQISEQVVQFGLKLDKVQRKNSQVPRHLRVILSVFAFAA